MPAPKQTSDMIDVVVIGHEVRKLVSAGDLDGELGLSYVAWPPAALEEATSAERPPAAATLAPPDATRESE